jgi:hypothetical protein
MAASPEPGTCASCGSDSWVRSVYRHGRTICERCVPAVLASKGLAPSVQAPADQGDIVSWVASLAFLGHGAGRRLTRSEAETLYPGRLSAHYGEPITGPCSDLLSDALSPAPPSENTGKGAA